MTVAGAIEWMAVGFGLAYLVLAMREHIACWLMALISTVLFLWLFWQAQLWMESALQLYYIAMAFIGWRQWRGHRTSSPRQIQTLSLRVHGAIIVSVLLLGLLSGALLENFTNASQPYLDSFTTWGAIITTVMVAFKILENWLYWIVVDIASMVLYANSELWVTTGLFGLYCILAVLGYREWRSRYHLQISTSSTL